MGVFDSFADSPEQIKTEGQEITLKFDRTGPTTGRVSWNIPPPARGCSADTQAYDGIVVTLDTTPINVAKNPVDGSVYTSDPTADTNLHAGDRIDSSLVIGAFYSDKTTTFVDVSGLQANVPYYVSAFAVDAQIRYHTQGVHAYSLDAQTANGTPDTPGSQVVSIGDGINGTDGTGLIPGTIYDFLISIDGTDYSVDIDGTDAATYDDLVAAINVEIAQLANAPQSALAPDTGAYYWNPTAEELFQWDGGTHNPLPSIIEDTDPTILTTGRYWYNPTTGLLQRWDTPLAGVWNATTVIRHDKDLSALSCDDYWFNGTSAYQWDGSVWCEKTLWNQSIDPSLPTTPTCGTYWYDEVSLILSKWNNQSLIWEPKDAIYWGIDPTSLSLGTFWFDDTTQSLFDWDGTTWNSVVVEINDSEPNTPSANMYWFDESNDALWQRDLANVAWVSIDVIVWSVDPIPRSTCDLWWDSVTDQLFIWDITTSTWDLVVAFTQSEVSPNTPPNLTIDDVWYNTNDMSFSVWDGSMWVPSSVIEHPTDPTIIPIDLVWYNTVDMVWNRWDGVAWDIFDPIDSLNDPQSSSIASGTYWFDTTSNTLNQWNGTTWVPLLFTTIPLTPSTGTLWYDTTNDVLNVWDGTAWVLAPPLATTVIDGDGNLLFTSGTVGGSSIIELIDGVLFSSLTPPGTILPKTHGCDGVSGIPMSEQIGVGSDGSADERRKLTDSMRAQLGYPVVDVELTKYQMDTAVTLAIEEFRKRSSAAYKRGYFFLEVERDKQHYLLTDKAVGFNKIVGVSGLFRMSSAFFGNSAYGNSIFGGALLQQLYTFSGFDFISYHLMSQYIEQMEELFANRLTYQWSEHTRMLSIMNTFGLSERILVDARIERTEQELMTDRMTKTWIEKYAISQARIMLAEIRGKHQSLPGAGGGVSFNAADLQARADADINELIDQIESYVADTPEEWGGGSTFIVG